MGDAEVEAGAREGVILDVGLGVGAVVAITSSSLLGREVELSPHGDRGRRVHAVVHERWTGRARVCAAVFVDVAAGGAELWLGGQFPAGGVEVRSGEVATIDLRGADPAG
jgi:hypothetical protein